MVVVGVMVTMIMMVMIMTLTINNTGNTRKSIEYIIYNFMTKLNAHC